MMKHALLSTILLLTLFAPAVFAAEEQGTVVYVIPFEGEVEHGLLKFLSKGFDEAIALGAEIIVLEMDTPGGRVDAALDIVDLMLKSEIPVVILVSGGATSAGAIISLAADDVYMIDSGLTTIGTAAPVLAGDAEQSDNMEAKTMSYVLAQVRAICKKQEFSEQKTQIALAMVDKDVVIAHPDNPDEYITQEGDLLTLTAHEAVEFGFIAALVEDRAQMLSLRMMGDAKVIERYVHPLEKIGRFFSSSLISSLLLSVAVLGIFAEFRTPGVGIPGLIGGIALLLFLLGYQIAGLAGWEGPILLAIGAVLILVELIVIPGFGLPGFFGMGCILLAVVITQVGAPLDSPHFLPTMTLERFIPAVLKTTLALLIGTIGALLSPLLFPVLGRTPIGSWMILSTDLLTEDGYTSADESLAELLEKQGVTRSTLRPAGIAEVDGKRIDVVSQGGYIQPGTAVKVVKVEGRRVVVKPC